MSQSGPVAGCIIFQSLSPHTYHIWVQVLARFPTANHYFQTQSFQLQHGGFVGCWLSKLWRFSVWKLLLFAPELLSFSGRWPRPWDLRRKTTTRYPSLASKGSGHLLSQAVPHHRCISEGVGDESTWQTFRTQKPPTVCLSSGFFILFLNRYLLDCPSSSRLSLKPMHLWASQLMVTPDDLQLEPGTEERGSCAFKQLWASVLANPVTNSVYYKAAMSLLPSRGPSPTGGCVRLGELFLKHVLSLLWSSSHMFSELQSPSLLSWFLPLRSPFLCSLLSLFPALLIKGAACAIWARAREPVLCWDIPGDRTYYPARKLPQILLLWLVLQFPIWAAVPYRCLFPRGFILSAPLLLPPRGWERNLQPEAGTRV